MADLEGAELDAAVWIALYYPAPPGAAYPAHYKPSTNWAQGGPIIQRERIWLQAMSDGSWFADAARCHRTEPHDEGSWCTQGRGPTPLIAAMRAFCASKMGDEIELP